MRDRKLWALPVIVVSLLGYTLLGLAQPRVAVPIGLALVVVSALASWRLGWAAEDRDRARDI